MKTNSKVVEGIDVYSSSAGIGKPGSILSYTRPEREPNQVRSKNGIKVGRIYRELGRKGDKGLFKVTSVSDDFFEVMGVIESGYSFKGRRYFSDCGISPHRKSKRKNIWNTSNYVITERKSVATGTPLDKSFLSESEIIGGGLQLKFAQLLLDGLSGIYEDPKAQKSFDEFLNKMFDPNNEDPLAAYEGKLNDIEDLLYTAETCGSDVSSEISKLDERKSNLDYWTDQMSGLDIME